LKSPSRASRSSASRRAPAARAERLQKLLSELGLASRRQAESWIRAGRLSVNGVPAVLGMRVGEHDQLRLDGRLIRQRAARTGGGVLLCHRSSGEPLLAPPLRAAPAEAAPAGRASGASIAERLPRRVGRRFISVSPMPAADGGLELLSADGLWAERLQRRVRHLEAEFSLRVRGQIGAEQQQAVLRGRLAQGRTLQVRAFEPSGGEGANRWYRLVALGASGQEVRALIEQQGVTLVRALRTRLGALELPRSLARGQWRALSADELSALLDSPGSAP